MKKNRKLIIFWLSILVPIISIFADPFRFIGIRTYELGFPLDFITYHSVHITEPPKYNFLLLFPDYIGNISVRLELFTLNILIVYIIITIIYKMVYTVIRRK